MLDVFIALFNPHPEPVESYHVLQASNFQFAEFGCSRTWNGDVGHQIPSRCIGERLWVCGGDDRPFGLLWPIRTRLHLQSPPALLGAIAKPPFDLDPLARLLSTLPASRLGHFLQGPRGAYPMPPVMRGLEGKHIAQLEGPESLSQGAVLSVEVISYHRSKRDASGVRPVNQFQRDREFCPKGGIVLALLKVVRRGVGFEIDGVIDLFVRPQAGDGDHSIVNLAQLSQILPADMSRLVAIFAIPSLIDDQNSLGRGRGRRVLAQQLESAFLYLALIPIRFREKPLQRLRSWQLGSD